MTPLHDSFTLTRDIAACRAHVWACWEDPALKRKWFVDNDSDGWSLESYSLSFTRGGRETGVWTVNAPGEPWHGRHRNDTTWLDIAPQDHIVYAYTMALNDQIHSASLATVLFADADGGTRLTFTEQIVLYDSRYGVDNRRNGWSKLLDTLETTLRETAT